MMKQKTKLSPVFLARIYTILLLLALATAVAQIRHHGPPIMQSRTERRIVAIAWPSKGSQPSSPSTSSLTSSSDRFSFPSLTFGVKGKGKQFQLHQSQQQAESTTKKGEEGSRMVGLFKTPKSKLATQNEEAEQAAAAKRGRWSLMDFATFLRARAGSGRSPVYWAIQGELSNPLTGDVIAEVRGLEVTRLLPLSSSTKKQLSGSSSSLGASSHAVLSATNKSLKLSGSSHSEGEGKEKEEQENQWQSIATILSAKSFRYLHPRTGEPMTSFKPTPRSKPRPVPIGSTSLQAITYAINPAGQLHLISESTKGALVTVDDQGSGPQSNRFGLIQLAARKFELSILMWPGSKGRTAPWSSIIQIGGSSAQPPCRELYALDAGSNAFLSSSKPRMRYLRYGECPHWCGAGRVCHLSLQGTRYDQLNDVPKPLRTLLLASPPPVLPNSAEAFVEEAEQVKKAMKKRFIFF